MFCWASQHHDRVFPLLPPYMLVNVWHWSPHTAKSLWSLCGCYVHWSLPYRLNVSGNACGFCYCSNHYLIISEWCLFFFLFADMLLELQSWEPSCQFISQFYSGCLKLRVWRCSQGLQRYLLCLLTDRWGTHPEQHGSLARIYISTILFGIHNLFVEDRYCCSSLYLLISDTEGQEKQTQSCKWGQICNWVPPETSSFYVAIGLFCWLKPLFVCTYRSDNCGVQFVKVKKSVVKLVITPIFHSSMFSVDLILMKIEDPGISVTAVKSRCKLLLSPSLIVLYFSSCYRPEAFNSLKVLFIIIMHFLLFNSSIVFHWSLRDKIGFYWFLSCKYDADWLSGVVMNVQKPVSKVFF